MDKGSFNKLLRRTVAIPVVLLGLLAAVLVVEVLSLTAALRWVGHTDLVLSGAREVMRDMVDMETGLRGYQLTGNAVFLEPYSQVRAQLPEHLSNLENLTVDNPEQSNRIRQIRDLDSRWIEWADGQLAKHGASPPSPEDFQTGKQLMNDIRAHQRDLTTSEEQLRVRRAHRATVLNAIVIISALCLTLATAVVLFTLTRSELFALSSTYERHLKAEADKTQQLEESRESLQTTLQSLGEAVISTDAAGQVTFVNAVAERLTGWGHEDAYGRPLEEVLQVIDQRRRVALDDPFARVHRSGLVVDLSQHVALVKRSGEECSVELTGAPILNQRKRVTGVVIVFRDITQRRQTEQTLRASDRLTTAGRLSATIAHEIRNPLDTVSNLVYLLQQEEQTSPAAGRYLQLASEELARIAQITTQLLTFHREAQAPVEVNLRDVLQSAMVLFAPQIRRNHVEVEERFADVRPVRGFPGELRQVFSNLVGNAIEAMPNGGKLILHVWESSLAANPRRRGVRVTVLDTGAGIPAGVRKNLYAPFFTTKGERGTGLGLWVSRGIVDKHEGSIYLRSSVRAGRSGTAFSVFLPFEQELGKLDVPFVPPAA